MRSLIVLALLFAHAALGTPVNFHDHGGQADDAVRLGILAGGAPKDIFEVRKKLAGFGGTLTTHIVANRGHENPEAGSFSFFESYAGPIPGSTIAEGQLFIGFFTEREGDVLQVQQEPQGLMIELIAWDRTKQMFNFWELIGNGTSSEWNYRGDSNDILADIAQVDITAGFGGAPTAVFGRRLRCSGCHTLGAPIMKELALPHNDWWSTEHKLSLGTMKLRAGASDTDPANVAARLFAQAADAEHLAKLVRESTATLLAARAAHVPAGLTLRHQLRSLAYTVEMNLASDTRPFAERVAGTQVQLPAGFFVDARLSGDATPVAVDAAVYRAQLARAGSKFAADEQPGLAETRHAFVVPTRSNVDQNVLDALVKQGLIDEETIADVLAVDFTTPTYSEARASLLAFFPESATSAADLRDQLIARLKAAPAGHAAAAELLANLTDPARDAAFHRKNALAYLARVRAAGSQPDAVLDWLKIAAQRRLEIAEAQTSKNPRGTILEPGFRVIFPTDALNAQAGALKLDPATGRAAAARAVLPAE